MPTLMVVAVIPTSLAGAAGPAEEAWPDAAADAADDAAADDAGPDAVLLAELQPAASRTAAASPAASPARRVRAGIRLPPGLSLLDLTSVAPSKAPLPTEVSAAEDLCWPRQECKRLHSGMVCYIFVP
jgi:hypothetical protein